MILLLLEKGRDFFMVHLADSLTLKNYSTAMEPHKKEELEPFDTP